MRTLTSVLAAALLPASAAAQVDSLHRHDGFWIGFGVGSGKAEIDCVSACGAPQPIPSTWKSGPGLGFQLSMGGTPRSNVLLGGEVGGLTRFRETHDATVVWTTVVAQVYPSPRRGFFVRAGLGLGGTALTDQSLGITDENAIGNVGVAVQAAIGYDVRSGGRFGLAPMAQYVAVIGDGAESTIGGRRYVGPKNPGALLIGLAFNWY